MDHDRQTRTPFMEDLRVLCQQITVLGADPIPPAMLEEMAGVTLLHAEGIVNTVRVPLVVLDATLHVLMANRYFYDVLPGHAAGDGGAPALRLGQRPVEHSRPAGTSWRRLCRTTPPSTISRSCTRFRTSARSACSSMPAKSSALQGTSPLILLAIEDITARWQAEATLRQQRDLLAVTLGSIGDAVLTTDTHGRITFLNPVAEALTGWPLLGRPRPAVRGGVPARP